MFQPTTKCGVKVTNSILLDNLFEFPSHRLAELIISQIYGHFVTLRIHDFFLYPVLTIGRYIYMFQPTTKFEREVS